VYIIVVGFSYSTQPVARSTSTANTDYNKMFSEGYLVGKFPKHVWKKISGLMNKHLAKKDVVWDHLFNGEPFKEPVAPGVAAESAVADDEEVPVAGTGRSITAAESHLSDTLTKQMCDAVVDVLTAAAAEAEGGPDVAWLKEVFAAPEGTFVVKTHLLHEESQMVHVDSIPVGVERLGSKYPKEVKVQFQCGPWTIIIPLAFRHVGVVPGGHRKWTFKLKNDNYPDDLQLETTQAVEDAVEEYFKRADMTLEEKWDKVFALVAANYEYSGDLYFLDLHLKCGDFLLFHHSLPHLGMGNFSKAEISMVFLVLQQKNTPLVMMPRTVLVTECMNAGRFAVRCSVKCENCKLALLMVDFWTISGPLGDERVCSGCYTNRKCEGGLKEEYAPSSAGQFDEAMKVAKGMVNSLVYSVNPEYKFISVGAFNNQLIQEPNSSRFQRDLASFVCHWSKAQFSRKISYNFGDMVQRKALPQHDNALWKKLEGSFNLIEGICKNDKLHWSFVVAEVMAKTGQGTLLPHE
jgi:hypothetical protein